MGDYNPEVTETSMQESCESRFLQNMVKKPTCFKNPAKPTHSDHRLYPLNLHGYHVLQFHHLLIS